MKKNYITPAIKVAKACMHTYLSANASFQTGDKYQPGSGTGTTTDPEIDPDAKNRFYDGAYSNEW